MSCLFPTVPLLILFVDPLYLQTELKGLLVIIGLYSATTDVCIMEVTKVSTLRIFSRMRFGRVVSEFVILNDGRKRYFGVFAESCLL